MYKTVESVEKGLLSHLDELQSAEHAVADEIFESKVKPYLKKHSLSIHVGMGSYGVWKQRSTVLLYDAPLGIRKWLEIPTYSGQPLGSLMPSYGEVYAD